MKKKSIITLTIVATSLLATTALTISHNAYSNKKYKNQVEKWSLKDYEYAIYNALGDNTDYLTVNSYCVLTNEKETICIATYNRKEPIKYIIKVEHKKITNFLFNVDYVLKATHFIHFADLK